MSSAVALKISQSSGLSERMNHLYSSMILAFPLSCRLHHLLRRVCQIGSWHQVEAALGEQFSALGDVRSFEANDKRDRRLDFLEGGDDGGCDGVALHDAAEDVDEDRLHTR